MMKRFYFFHTILITIFLLASTSLSAAVITVTNSNDSGLGSLREAVAMALANADASDQILFDAATDGTPIGLTFAEIPINLGAGESMTIAGNGIGTTTIDSEGTGRIFNISGGIAVTITNLTLTGGQNGGTTISTGDGGAILTSTNLTVTNIDVTGNNARAGAGIYNDGATLTVTNATFTNNEAFGTLASGGAIYNDGILDITNSDVSNNLAKRAGGGIEGADGSTNNLTNVTLDNNSLFPFPAPGNGGGLHLSGAANATISGGTVNGNKAAVQGGGLWNGTGTMTIDGTNIDGNDSQGNMLGEGAGGIYNNGGTLTITSAMISNNTAEEGFGSGGGILTNGGTLDVTGTTIDANLTNRAGGGIEASTNAVVTLDDVTMINNEAGGVPPNDAPGNGGGMHVTGAGTTNISNSNISNNNAALEGGGLWNGSGIMTIDATEINTNVAAGDDADNGGGGIFNSGGILNLTDININSNNATGAEGSGGGILNDAGIVNISGTTVIRDNMAVRAGGGIEATAGSTTDLTDVILLDNTTGANPGNGGGMHLTGTANATLTNGNVSGNLAASEGGGLWNGIGTLTIDGTEIKENLAFGDDADNGGGGIFNAGGTVDITNALIDLNTATGIAGSGGGILNDAMGTVIISATVITNNSANRAGGGIEATAGTTTNLTDVTLDDNDAGISLGAPNPGNGGGLHISGDGDVNITNGTVKNNLAALEGGGLWNGTGSMMLDNVTISTNTASGNAADNGGGGIFNAGGSVNITGGLIDANVANGTAGSGGGILNDAGGTLTVNGTEISENQANRAGGGIEVTAGTVNSFTDIVLSANLAGVVPATPAPGNGGGLHVTGNGSVGFINSIVSFNQAALEGGGLWNGSGAMTLNGTIVNQNIASGDAADDGGGGIFNNGGLVTIVNGAQITNNIANGVAGSGGGIFNLGGNLVIEDSEIFGNTSTRAGGGIEATAGSTNNLTNVTLNNNVTDTNLGNGGGMHITGAGDAIITDGTVNENSATNEGGGLWNGAGLMTITGTTIDGNSASGDAADNGGGGIFNEAGTVNIITATITNNVADGTEGSGGGILNNDNATLVVFETTIANNTASRAGGGIEARGGTTTTLTNVILDANNAAANPGNGGGMHITADGNVTITNGSVINNIADSEGGGLWNGIGTMTITGTLIDGNTASGPAADNGGGGIFNAGGTVIASNNQITNNVADGAAGSGGGILNDGGILTVTNVEISNNTASRAGGGIEVTAGSTNTLSLVLLNINTTSAAPGNGGGMHATGAATTTIDQTTVDGNTAANEGGGLWAFGAGEMTVTNSTVSNNNAPDGGGLFVQAGGGTLNLTNSTVSGNSATTGGGIGGGAGSTVNIASVTIANNTATTSGGGVEATALTLNSESSIIGDNNAPTGADVNGAFALVTTTLVESENGVTGITEGVAGNIVDYDAQLAPLADNGGVTLTHLPSGASPVLDKGNSTLATDQREFPRVIGGVADMGAVELGVGNLNNDLCANAITLGCSDLIYGTLGTATAADAPTACLPENTSGNPGLWYKLVGTGIRITVSTDFLTNFDTEINVYTGACGALTCLGGDDDSAANNTSTFTFDSEDGVTYFIYVSGENGTVGQFQIGYDAKLRIFCPPTVHTNTDPDVCGAIEPLLQLITIEGNCVVGTVSSDAPTFFPVGSTIVTYTVTSNIPSILTQTCTQEVIVVDNEAPMIACPNTFEAYTSWSNCGYPTAIMGTATATDECSAVTITADPTNPTGLIGPGQYGLTYIATDAAGNQSTCTQWVKIYDETLPQLVTCPGDILVIVQTANGANVSWTEPTAIDNCAGTITPLSNFNSGDFFNLGETDVVYELVDPNGNAVTCEFTVTVTADNPNVAISIAGIVATEVAETVENVAVHINGTDGMTDMHMTVADGIYDFNVPMGGDFTLVPANDIEPLNGVTTFDLVKISKHILNIEALDSPYKMIAADANNSQTITTLDLVKLRKLILLIDTELSENTSWRFVYAGYEFPNPTNPWAETFPEIISWNNLNVDQVAVDFVAIKIGDVNASAQTNQLLGADDRTFEESLAIAVDNQMVEEGEMVTVDFKVNDLAHFGYQFTLQFENLAFVNLENGLAKEDNFGMQDLQNGILTTSWNQADAERMDGETVLFSATFKALADGELSDFLSLASTHTPAEAYAENGELAEVVLEFDGQKERKEFALLQNFPNPFNNQTTIEFYLPNAENGTLTITDRSGKTIQVIERNFQKGLNQVKINSTDFNINGLFYYELTTPNFHATKRMIYN
jgi:hypothetical protein